VISNVTFKEDGQMSNMDQIDYWNGPGGERWVTHADKLDTLLSPFADAVLDEAQLQLGESVLDIGCGAGALSLGAASRIGERRGVRGVDVSRPLIGLASQRAASWGAPAIFEIADASIYRAPDPIDAVISRFGVMFFDDPVAAFANIRISVRPEGRIVFACWQSLALNDWARAPLDAVMPLLPAPPTPPPAGAPGPFAFACRHYVSSILSDAGWRGIATEIWQDKLRLPGDSIAEAAAFMMELSPVARLVNEAGVDLAKVESALQFALEPHLQEDGHVYMPAAAWIVSATAS
jgi:SAM-dependent methyltransferase